MLQENNNNKKTFLDVSSCPVGSLVKIKKPSNKPEFPHVPHFPTILPDMYKHFVIVTRAKIDPVSCEPISNESENHLQFLRKGDFEYYANNIYSNTFESLPLLSPENRKLFKVKETMLLVDGKKIIYEENDLQPREIWSEITLLFPDGKLRSIVVNRSTWTLEIVANC